MLLDGIARSDGTRASVTRAPFATQVRNALTGSFSFTPAGDTTTGSVTTIRVEHAKPCRGAFTRRPSTGDARPLRRRGWRLRERKRRFAGQEAREGWRGQSSAYPGFTRLYAAGPAL